MFNLKGILYVVRFRNPGKLRFSSTAIAMLIESKPEGAAIDVKGQRKFLLLNGSDKTLTPEEFDAYAKQHYPQTEPTEIIKPKPQGNPDNPTLDVQSGSAKSTGGL